MWALVTGGAKRLGAALCLSLAEKGYGVVVHYRHSETEARDIMTRCQDFGVPSALIQGDFSSAAALEDFINRYLDQFPETNILINNVGNYLLQSILQTSFDNWTSLFQLNVHTPFRLTQALAPSLIKHQGQVINLGVAGLLHQGVKRHTTAYALAKQTLWGLTRSLADEFAPHNVRVNMVSPGVLDISVDLSYWMDRLPMGRPGYPEEVCRVVTFLLDPSSEYITGQNIEIAGGFALT